MTTSQNQFKKQMSLYSRLSQNSSQAFQIENFQTLNSNKKIKNKMARFGISKVWRINFGC